MWGHDVKVRKELSKRELAKMGLKDDQKMPLEDKTISYTKEDCKSLKRTLFLIFQIVRIYFDIHFLFEIDIIVTYFYFPRFFTRTKNNESIMGLL